MMIGDLIMRVLIDDKGFDANLQKTAKKSGANAGKTLGGEMKKGLLAGLGLGGGLAAVNLMTSAVSGLTQAFFESINAASNLNEAVSKSDAVFDESSGEIQDWAGTASEAFGQSKRQALEAAGTFGNLIQAFGIGADSAADMSKTLVELASDLASFNNTSVDEAIIALRAGLSGETEPLKRYGIALNDVRLKEEALRMGLITTTKGVLPVAIKTQAAYSLILKDSALAQGDFARTADGLANTQKTLTAQMEDLSAEVGAELLPIMLELATVLRDDVLPAGKDLLDVLRDIGGTGVGLGDVITGIVNSFNPLHAQLDEARNAARDWERDSVSSTNKVAEAVASRSGEMRGDLAQVDDSFRTLATRTQTATETARISMKQMRDGSRELRDAFLADALAILSDYYDPIEARQELITLKKEATEQRQIIASKNSTKAQIADAKKRLSEIERRTNELLFELGSTGKATQKEISAAITTWQKKARTAKGQAVADIRAIIRQLMLLKLAALQASGALNFGGLAGAGRGRHAGGPVKAHEAYVVGEKRAELFVPDVDGTIIPSVPAGWGQAMSTVTNNTYPTLNVQGALPVRTIRDVSIEMQRIAVGVTPSRQLTPQYDRGEAT
jgi:hypothetical protein